LTGAIRAERDVIGANSAEAHSPTRLGHVNTSSLKVGDAIGATSPSSAA
jgi:hypothetical protein